MFRTRALLPGLALVLACACGEATTPARSFRTPGGVLVDVLVEGAGPEARPGDHLALRYASFHAGGTDGNEMFETNVGAIHPPFYVTLGTGEVIRGWEEGLAGIAVGEKRRLHVPAALAYGDEGAAPHVRPGEDLVFEVERVVVPALGVSVTKPGDGPRAAFNATIVAQLHVRVAETGQVVTQSADPVTFTLRRAASAPFEGLIQGLIGAAAGETRRLTVPAEMAYGAVGRPPQIPPDADLVVDVEILEVR